MTDSNGTKYVTWRSICIAMSAQVVAVLAIAFGFYQAIEQKLVDTMKMHAAQPHMGAASNDDIKTLREEVNRSLQSIELDVREIRNAVRK